MECAQKARERKDENMREYVDKKMKARCTCERKKDEEVREKRRSQWVNEEGDNEMEEAREKRKRDESVDDDEMKKAKSSSSGQESM